MSRRVDLKPSAIEPDRDVIQYRPDGGYLLMNDLERRWLIHWVSKMSGSSWDEYDKAMSLLQGRGEDERVT